MGADGHITIWRMDHIEAEWPDGADLLNQLPNTYIHELDGVRYAHAYHGDGMYVSWREPEDWLGPRGRLKAFVEWLEAHKTAEWEVWT